MKRKLSLLLALVLALTLMLNATVAVAAETPIKLAVDGQEIQTDTPPQIVNGRTLVPVRAFVEAIGFNAQWMSVEQTVLITNDNDDTLLQMVIGDNEAFGSLYEEYEFYTMDVPAQIIDGRTMVPARFIAEYFGYTVSWDEQTRTIYLTSDN